MPDQQATSTTMPSAATSPSEPSGLAAMQRARGAVRVSFKTVAGRTVLARLFQEGAAKIRLPRVPGEGAEAVLINTAGGLTGGDALDFEVEAGASATVTATTQACEKVYRSAGGVARVDVRLKAGAGARLDWLPQETILFDRSALARGLAVDLADDAVFLAVEPVLYGRQAMGEQVTRGLFRDRWRIHRAGRLIFADDVRLEGPIADLLARPALGGGNRALASLIYCAPDAERLVDKVRGALGDRGAASVFDGKLVARLAAPDGMALRGALIATLGLLRGPSSLPKVWTI